MRQMTGMRIERQADEDDSPGSAHFRQKREAGSHPDMRETGEAEHFRDPGKSAHAPERPRAPRRVPLIQISEFKPKPKSLLDDPDPPGSDASPAPESTAEVPVVDKDAPLAGASVSAPEMPGLSTPAPAVPGALPVLIDTRTVLHALWRHRRVALALALGGLLAGAALGPFVPRKFSATASLYFDPRQIEVAVEPAAQAPFNRDAFLAVIDSQTRILTSLRVLEKTALALGLDQDPSYTGRSDGRALQAAIDSLQKSLKVEREDNTYIVNLTVTGKNADRSAEIANQVVASFLQEEDLASSGFYRDAGTTLDGRLDVLAGRLQDAERAVETYKAGHGMVSADGGLIADKRLLALDEMVLAAQKATIEAEARAEAVGKLDFQSLIGEGLPDSVQSPTLIDLRRQYSVLAANVKSLETRFGSRHPQLAAARASLDGVAGEIRRELQRHAAATRAGVEQARKAEADLVRQMTAQKTAQSDSSLQQVELNELVRRAAAARSIYETVLKRTQQTGEEQNLSRSNIRIVSKAEPPLKPDGPGRTALMAATAIGGLIAGLGAAVLYALVRVLALHPYFRGLATTPQKPSRPAGPRPSGGLPLDSRRRPPSIREEEEQAEYLRRWRKRR